VESKIVVRTEPFTLDDVMEFIDSIVMNDNDRHQLKCMINDIADASEGQDARKECEDN